MKVAAPVTAKVDPSEVAPLAVKVEEAESVVKAPVEALLAPMVVPLIEPPVAVKVPAVIELEDEDSVKVLAVVEPLLVTESRVEVSEIVRLAEDEAIEMSVPAFNVAFPTIPLTVTAVGIVTEMVGELGLVESTLTLGPALMVLTTFVGPINFPVITAFPLTVKLPLMLVSVLSCKNTSEGAVAARTLPRLADEVRLTGLTAGIKPSSSAFFGAIEAMAFCAKESKGERSVDDRL